jgi:hypothetical protein
VIFVLDQLVLPLENFFGQLNWYLLETRVSCLHDSFSLIHRSNLCAIRGNSLAGLKVAAVERSATLRCHVA